jgi:hypothetical protein
MPFCVIVSEAKKPHRERIVLDVEQPNP